MKDINPKAILENSCLFSLNQLSKFFLLKDNYLKVFEVSFDKVFVAKKMIIKPEKYIDNKLLK